MFLIKLLNILRGYVIVSVKGVFLERFLNICTHRSIALWNIKRSGKNQMLACISISDFKRIRGVAQKSFCRVHIVKRVGVPFFLNRHKKRKALLIGASIVLLMIFNLSRYIWVIDVSGNSVIATELIVKELAASGVKYGVNSKSIDVDYVQNTIIEKVPELSWIGIDIKGTTALVEVKERNVLPDAFPKNEPCSIVAAYAGVIERADVKEGERLVKPGDVVTKGQILVSGILEGDLSGIRYVHSEGEIIARTWHEKTVDLPLFKEIKTPTGKEKSKHTLKILDFYVKLYLDDRISFENYERISSVKKLSLGNGFALPISFHYDNYVEQSVTKVKMTEKEAVEFVYSQMNDEFCDSEIIGRKYKINGNKLTVTFECLENIIQKVGF